MTGILVVAGHLECSPCMSFSAVEVVGQHGRASAGFSGRADPRKWTAPCTGWLVRRHFRWQVESRSAMNASKTVLSTVRPTGSVLYSFSSGSGICRARTYEGTLLHVLLMTFPWQPPRACRCGFARTSAW